MADMAEKIKNAKVLLYEDTAEYGIGEWIQETLERMQIRDVTLTGDDIGIFLSKLNSPTKWDLIIIGAESKRGVQGEFWPVIMDQAHNKVAIIAEIWYLDLHGAGKIREFTNECGIAYQRDYPLTESIYWWDQYHPVFTTPNIVDPLLMYSRFWANEAGDKLRLTSGGDAKFIAGDKTRPATDGGLLAVCMEGRTIYQAFSNHDFHEGQIKDLWENYITYTLTNHFLATQP